MAGRKLVCIIAHAVESNDHVRCLRILKAKFPLMVDMVVDIPDLMAVIFRAGQQHVI